MELIGKFVLIVSYLLIILGSFGMILFAIKFSVSTNIRDLEYIHEKVFFLNGFQLWATSWSLIIAGTAIQLVDYILRNFISLTSS